MGDKQAAKQRRRENREQRERDKETRKGESPAQKAEQVRRENEVPVDETFEDTSGRHG